MDVTTFDNLDGWARVQWATAALGDRRRTRRAVQVGAALAADPPASLPSQTARWGELKAAYHLLNEPDVTHAALSTPHWRQTRAAARGAEPGLFIQDTTELDYSTHRHTRDLGPIGDGRGHGRLALLGLLAIVAVRLLQVRMLARQAPGTPALSSVPPDLVAVVAASLHVAPATLSVRHFWRGVAQLGGFIGRAGDGEPGWQTLWAGWWRLQERVWGYHLAQAP